MLIDWDTTLIAPPERDLWSLVGEDPAVSDAYTALTGTAVDPGAIELYRLGWDLAEIAIYVTQFRRPHVTAKTRELHGRVCRSASTRLVGGRSSAGAIVAGGHSGLRAVLQLSRCVWRLVPHDHGCVVMRHFVVGVPVVVVVGRGFVAGVAVVVSDSWRAARWFGPVRRGR